MTREHESVAARAVGEVAFAAAFEIRAGGDDDLTRRLIGAAGNPDGLWQAVFEAAFQAAQYSNSIEEVVEATKSAALRAASDERYRANLIGTIGHRMESERFAIVTEMAGLVLGRQALELGMYWVDEELPGKPLPELWYEVYVHVQGGYYWEIRRAHDSSILFGEDKSELHEIEKMARSSTWGEIMIPLLRTVYDRKHSREAKRSWLQRLFGHFNS